MNIRYLQLKINKESLSNKTFSKHNGFLIESTLKENGKTFGLIQTHMNGKRGNNYDN